MAALDAGARPRRCGGSGPSPPRGARCARRATPLLFPFDAVSSGFSLSRMRPLRRSLLAELNADRARRGCGRLGGGFGVPGAEIVAREVHASERPCQRRLERSPADRWIWHPALPALDDRLADAT